MADNLKYSKHKELKGKVGYDHYDNYDAIEIPFVDAIPEDYDGAMGVPITFLDKYCPDQFEILGSFNASSLATKADEDYVLSRDTPIIINGKESVWNGPVVNKKPLYKRIVIRKKLNKSLYSAARLRHRANPSMCRSFGAGYLAGSTHPVINP